MRCLKTRALLVLLTAVWVLGVLYFLSGLKGTEPSQMDDFDEFDTDNSDEYDHKKDTDENGKVGIFTRQKKERSKISSRKVRFFSVFLKSIKVYCI